jgi:hypothetical protein
MPNSVLIDPHGPDWPLGFIKVVTPGTPVRITLNVDPQAVNAPETATQSTAAEYTVRFQQLMFQGYNPASHGMQNNSGLVYIIRYLSGGAGSGNRDDTGVIVAVLSPGQTLFLASAPHNRDVWSPYRYALDADNGNDGALITGIVQ